MGLIIPWNPQAVHGDMTDRPLYRVWGIILDGIQQTACHCFAVIGQFFLYQSSPLLSLWRTLADPGWIRLGPRLSRAEGCLWL
jgi:hypothetical protein